MEKSDQPHPLNPATEETAPTDPTAQLEPGDSPRNWISAHSSLVFIAVVGLALVAGALATSPDLQRDFLLSVGSSLATCVVVALVTMHHAETISAR